MGKTTEEKTERVGEGRCLCCRIHFCRIYSSNKRFYLWGLVSFMDTYAPFIIYKKRTWKLGSR